ncbi:MAG: cupredoxin domain-containing protein [Candidatus Curtissbacteria bacterium]
MLNFKKKVGIFSVVILSVFLLSACNSNEQSSSLNETTTQSTSSSDTEESVVVTYSESGFSPSTVNVGIGQKVVFKNVGVSGVFIASDPHPTHSLYPELNVGMVNPGGEGAATFAAAGTYTYHNHLNANHKGTIVVQ